MTMRWIASLLLLIGLATPAMAARTAVSAPARTEEIRCETLLGGRFNHLADAATQITGARYIAATAERPAYCDLEGYINPTVGFGLWLPAHDWNGKYIVRGCGGSCGQVAMTLYCRLYIRQGYACLANDMGHRSTQSDNVWGPTNLQGQIDFAFRATHVATVAGKAIAKAYYGRDPDRSYFYGCSTGGRQGMIEAQRYPLDFDGIVSVAPASGMPFTGIDAGEAARRLDPRTFNVDDAGKSILTPRKLPMLHAAVIAACDISDGIKDGVIGDPRRCRFDPASIQCAAGDRRTCLTAPQVDVVRTIYRYSGMQPGSELTWISDFIHETPPKNTDAFVPRGDPDVFPILNNASNPDLRLFKAHGGKLINAQGWSDNQVNPLATIDYYELATRTMGGPAATTDFYRLFMVPGMHHCAAGDGPYAIDYIAALERWVEQGKAPDRLIGVHPTFGTVDFSNPNPRYLAAKDKIFSRPIYPYPQTAIYSGKGPIDQADSFVAQ